MKLKTTVFILFAAAVIPSFGNTIADWTFENSVPSGAGPYSPEVGSGSASGSHAGAAVYSSPAGNGSAHSYSSTVWAVNDYWQFQISTLGFDGIMLSWDQTSSSTGPRDFALEYSTDGNTFSQLGITGADYTVLANGTPYSAWSSGTSSSHYSYDYNLSLITALDNASTVYFRLVDQDTTSANGGTVGTGGTDRVDNFIVTGTVIPVSAPDSLPIGFDACAFLSILILSRHIPGVVRLEKVTA